MTQGNTLQGYGRRTQKEFMKKWWKSLATAEDEGRPVAYLFISGALEEILRVFDFEICLPEVTALNCAVRQQSAGFILSAEDIGYTQDVCGYVKNDIGLLLKGFQSPMGKLPKPTLLVCNYSGCTTYVKWFEALAELLHAPIYVLDVPYIREEDIRQEDIDYVVRQFHELIDLCERITGKKWHEEKFKFYLENSRQAEEYWVQVLEMAQHKPSPYDAYFEAVYFMSPIYIMRGLPETVEYYRNVVKELEERIERGMGPVAEERFRIVTEGPPPWPHLRDFWDMFKTWGAVNVASTYTKVGGLWDTTGIRHDPEKPFESMAKYAMSGYVNWSLAHRQRLIERYVKDYQADAVVIHSVKSCRSFAAGEADMREYFTKERDIPTLFIESDLVDPRYFQKAQMKNRIDAFFESLEHRKLLVSA